MNWLDPFAPATPASFARRHRVEQHPAAWQRRRAAGVIAAWSPAAVLLLIAAACGSSGARQGLSGTAELMVAPLEDFVASGTGGAGFQPSSKTYELTNQGSAGLSWEVVAEQGWVDVSPSSGTLEPLQSVAVLVSLGASAASLASGSHASSLSFRNLTNGIGNTTAFVHVTVTAPPAAAMTAATRTSGVAPLAVVFDASEASSGVVLPAGPTPDYGSFTYEWRYGDPASGVWPHNGKSRNQSVGWIGAHVYETPGSYTVTLRVTTADDTVLDYQQQIDVLDPAVVFAARTFYVAADGADANPGTQAAPFRTLDRGLAVAFSGEQPSRLLFRRGDVFPTLQTPALNGQAPGLIGAFGSGAKPVLQFGNVQGGINLVGRRDLRIVDVDLVSVAAGMVSSARGVTLGNQSTLLRCRIDSFGYGLEATNVSAATVSDCEILNGVEYGMYAYAPGLASGNHCALLGNRFDVAGFHLTRAYLNRSVWMSNLYGQAGFTAMAHVGRNAGSPPTQRNCIVDNSFTTDTIDIVAMGPANATFDEHAQDFLFEGNRFYSRSAGGSCLKIRGRRVTIRNNVFDVAGRRAVQVEQWTGSPVPLPRDVVVEHNTMYRGSGAPLRTVSSNSGNPTVVRFNLMFCAQGATEAPSGNVGVLQNLTADPLFANATSGDFALLPGSPAIDTAATSRVRADYFRRERPATAAPDVGAIEFSQQ